MANSPTAVQDHPLMEEKAALEAMNRELTQMIQKMNNISGRFQNQSSYACFLHIPSQKLRA